jgi:hypothetical protein
MQVLSSASYFLLIEITKSNTHSGVTLFYHFRKSKSDDSFQLTVVFREKTNPKHSS